MRNRNIDKVIALYLRLSMSDGDLGRDNKDESNSIENQRQLLRAYVEGRDDLEGEIREYVDDGYTGTNFKRPGFQKMVEEAGRGKIGIILVKDLSRLGRDYIGVGDYIEQIFPMMGVRFVAVNNSFDSEAYIGTTMGLDMAVSSLVNDLYSKDVSKKVRSSLEIKWRQGIATNSVVPFGYVWDKGKKGRWGIDPVASLYVRNIFDLALRGYGTREIAANLNSEKIPTPGVYAKRTKKGSVDNTVSPESEKLWTADMVRLTLRKYEYTGALVMGRRKHILLGSGCTRSIPQEDQIITENAHEAIATHEEFEEAQGVIRKIKPIQYGTPKEYPLKGLVRCGNCRRMMSIWQNSGEKVYGCLHKRGVGSYSKCYGGSHKESTVNMRVAYALREVMGMAKFLDDTVIRQKNDRSIMLEFPDTKKMKSELETLRAESIRQYEAYSDRVISREDYINKKRELTEKIHTLEEQMRRAEEINQEQEKTTGEVRDVADEYAPAPFKKDLKELAQSFIEAVYLYDDTRMEIVFKCEDSAGAVLDQCAANAEDGVLDYPYGEVEIAEDGTLMGGIIRVK
ncbi:MAG: recombinase family protein [Clostridiales bacterium]|nr:recombinase family protein [Clostridiales bacterium]